MKYEGQRPSGKDKDIPVYTFSIGKEELEILTKITTQAFQYTPKLTELIPYRGRLRNLVAVFGRTWTEVVKGRKLPIRKTHKFFHAILENLRK